MTEPVEVFRLPRLPRRPRRSHKGDYGRVLIVAGSPGMAGAAILCARAALRSGSGLVTAGIARSLAPAITSAVPEATQLLIPDAGASDFAAALGTALGPDLEARFDAIAVGPGLGTASDSARILEALLARTSVPHVLDADALNLVAAGVAAGRSESRVWTPHPGELYRLTGSTPRSDGERRQACRTFVAQRGGVVVLKGHRSVVHDARRVFINVTGNAGMATGGAGDVLTGIIASLLGQGLEPFTAACLGVYLHGLAGDIAARRFGEASLVASDIVEALAPALAAHAAVDTTTRVSC